MHLLAVQAGTIDDGSQAVDLGQEPGDIVVISAADSELAALARAQDGLPPGAPSLRLANFMQLGHNMSVDHYVEQTARHAGLIVVRLLGGASYWSYGLEQLRLAAHDHGIKLAVLPGDAQPDAELLVHSNLPEAEMRQLWHYLIEGGPDNAGNFLRYCAHILRGDEAPPASLQLLKAGLYWPGVVTPGLEAVRREWQAGATVAAVVFYRSLIEGGYLEPVDALIAELQRAGLNPLPIFVSSLKDEVSAATVVELFQRAPPRVVLNATGFAVSTPGGTNGGGVSGGGAVNPLAAPGRPILQVVFAGSSRQAWVDNPQGLSSRDLAMNVVLPELDGRILTRALSFKSGSERHAATQCSVVTYKAESERIAFTVQLARAWARLGEIPPARRRVAIVLANYPNRDGRIGNGVGLDTPASTLNLLRALCDSGYGVEGFPDDGDSLIRELTAGPTNRREAARGASAARLSLRDYAAYFDGLPPGVRQAVTSRWGEPAADPFVRQGAFHLSVRIFGNALVAIQPARGYNIDPKETFHDPDLVPPHGYLAFYCWLRQGFAAHAVIHNGKHGNLEWLPGKAAALSPSCYPEVALGPLPNIYPFIVNDPGEGTQAKRRSAAVIIDHMTPPLTRAGIYGPLKDFEALIDEYYLAAGLDPRRLELLRRHILELTRSNGLDEDCGIAPEDDEVRALQKLDNYLCELKEAQIRDGLHILGESPRGRFETDLLVALTRVPRNLAVGGDQSLIRALAGDLGLGSFDPLDCDLGAPWDGARPAALAVLDDASWRSNGDTVERLECLAARLVGGEQAASAPVTGAPVTGNWPRTQAVLEEIENSVRPRLRACGAREIGATLAALDGRFVEPGPSGAPSRGRLDVLPTGRNFFSIDNRAVPTPAAWTLGVKSAELLIERHLQEEGDWPTSFGLSAWGTSNMRTGGDDIAQALALIGVKPIWDPSSWRVTGFEILPPAALGRPRVDVTLRISGFFRDAFPTQIDLFDSAIRAVGALDEEAEDNPIAQRMRAEARELEAQGLPAAEAERRAGFRIFGSKPGAYGAGLQALIDEKLWHERGDFGRAYITWGGYAYGKGAAGEAEAELFARRLGGIEAVVHNQDNREHDLLDSDDYYQFEGGMTAAVEQVSGARPRVYHNDHSRPERPVIRTLEEEIGRVVRSRVVNPKWIAGVMRHGYKGAFEIAATVDYLFAFSATTGAVRQHHFQLTFDAFIGDEAVRDFMARSNPAGLEEMAARFDEAIERGLWSPKSNSAYRELQSIIAGEMAQ